MVILVVPQVDLLTVHYEKIQETLKCNLNLSHGKSNVLEMYFFRQASSKITQEKNFQKDMNVQKACAPFWNAACTIWISSFNESQWPWQHQSLQHALLISKRKKERHYRVFLFQRELYTDSVTDRHIREQERVKMNREKLQQ